MKDHGLTKLRHTYQTTSVPRSLREHGWEELSANLPRQALPWGNIARRSSIIAGLFILCSSSLVAASQPALPGNMLYPLKIATDNTWAHLTGTYDSTLIKRADEVIKASTISSQSAATANRAYQQTLQRAAAAAKKHGTTSEFKQTLQAQEERFQKATPSAHSHSLQRALEETEATQGEVQGASTDRHETEASQGNGNGQEKQNHGQNKKN